MSKRYLPFGYEIKKGRIHINPDQADAVCRIFQQYTERNSLQQIANRMTAEGIHYRPDTCVWNKNMVKRILENQCYCGTAEYAPIITAKQFSTVDQIRKGKTVAYSMVLKPFRKDMQCGCCGASLYLHTKSRQWFCRECGMWSAPTQAEETADNVVEKLCWLRQNPEIIHNPEGQANVQSVEVALLDREIWQALTNAEPDVD